MSTEQEQVVNAPRPRLKFIDMARSFAILLMIEGHFTGAALSDAYRKDEYLLYSLWHNLHGLTSPLFFTVTGLIFVYLLSGNTSGGYFSNTRVTKGFKRVRQLLFWGYFIQFNLWSFSKSIYYGSEFHMDWFYAFHVLQSISIGILFLLLIYGIYKLINKGALYWYYLIGGLSMLFIYAHMKYYIHLQADLVAAGAITEPQYWPTWAPKIIQNMFYGPYSDFSFVRYSGYTILGGMLGSIIRTYEHKTREWWFGAIFIAIALILNFGTQSALHWVDKYTVAKGFTDHGVLELTTTTIARLGQVIGVIGLLIYVDKHFNVKSGLFLKIGQNTLPIYVVHVIILYGGVLGFGLKPLLFDRDLHPWIAVSISVTFMVLFAIMVKYIEPLEEAYNKALEKISLKRILYRSKKD